MTKWQISLHFNIPQLEKSLAFCISESSKRYPFRAKPPRVGHYRECPFPQGLLPRFNHTYITPYHDSTLFLSIPDAYDDSDVIFKWKNADVHVIRDNMAQFQFMGASFSSNQDSYLNGKNKHLFKLLTFESISCV